MGKDLFNDSSIAPTHFLDHPDMAIWNSFFGAQELNCLAEKQSMDCFTNPIYNCLNTQTNHFDSSLSATISSPAPKDSLLLHRLIENSGTLSQIVDNNLSDSRNLESVSPVFPALVADQGLIERAAKFSCFSSKSQLGCSNGNSYEESSVLELLKNGEKRSKSPGELNSTKRKTFSQGNPKEDMVEIHNAKRSKVAEEHWKVHNGGVAEKETESGNDTSEDDESDQQGKGKQQQPEGPKDYIHVRARRGQATDSHSLAERARREKISERMKLLEDLVPGCNKVTGKALMLDEIINYVQALQHQVEFLSMKLASVNTGMSSAGDSLTPKAMFQQNALYSSRTQQAPQQHKNYASSVSVSQYPMNPLDRNIDLRMPLPPPDRSQISAHCEDDLESIVQMGLSHDGETTFQSPGFSAQNQVSSMKVEL